jgi:hypothetical protein
MKSILALKATLSLKMIMTELPIDNMFNNKQNNKSRSFKAHQQNFKRQQKRTEQISSLPKKIQKAISTINVQLVKQPKPKPAKIPKKEKAENKDIQNKDVQNILDETYEGEEDAYLLFEEIAFELHLEVYKMYIEKLAEEMRIEEEELQQNKHFENGFDVEDNYNFWEGYEEYEIRDPHSYEL